MKNPNCIKCNKPSTKVYRPDLDLTGIGMCKEHEEQVSVDIMTACFLPDGWEWFEKKYLKKK
jgi:hypothetical protein